jgi:hypothetical protein
VTWLQQPHNFQFSAFAFGRIGHRMVAVSGGAVVARAWRPADFDAVVLHELGHIRNRDLDQTYLAIAIWRAFVVAALLPMAVLLAFRLMGPAPSLIWRAAGLALLVYLLRNSVLRAREFDADARVAELDPATSLGQVLAAQPDRRGRGIWHLGWRHPSGLDRAAALVDPLPLYRCGFWDGLAIGLVAGIGAEAGQDLADRFVTPGPGSGLLPAFVFALFSGGALTVAMWRMRLLAGPAATAADWAVGLDLVLADSAFVEEFDASTKAILEQTWTFVGYDAARTTDAWVICLVFIAVPLAGYLARRPRIRLGQVRPLALIGLAGLVAVIAVTVVTAAVGRARIAPAVRWSSVYVGNFGPFEEQMVILVAVIVALIAAAMLTDELSDTIAIVVGAVIAALGILAMSGALTLGNCAAPFSLIYDHPPASGCPGYPSGLESDIFPAAIEAALIAILLIPAAHYGGLLMARRTGLEVRPRWRVRALRWLAAGVAAAAVITGIAVRVPDASAHGVAPIGAIGQDGWISGPGYQVRLFPNWYRLTRDVPGYIFLENDATFTDIPGELAIRATAVSPATDVRVPEARLVLLDGTRTLEMSFSYKGYFYRQWVTLHDDTEYLITFWTRPGDYPPLSACLTAMIDSWSFRR